jgi:hypothetical protein
MSYGPDSAPQREQQEIYERVRLPGTFLTIVGVINLLLGLFSVYRGVQVLRMDDVQWRAENETEWDNLPQGVKQLYEDNGFGKERYGELMRSIKGPVSLCAGAVALLAGVATTLGGIRMTRLQSYGLAMTGSVLAFIPIVSPCCLGGQVVGIWAMVVLLNRDVKEAFRTAAVPPDEGPSWGELPPP